MRQVPNGTAVDVEVEFAPLLGAREDQGYRIRWNKKGYAILDCWLQSRWPVVSLSYWVGFGGFAGSSKTYLYSILYHRKFFETVRPVNFTTFASPHIGLPRYPNLFSKLAYKWGPTLLSRTGEQFWSTDSWGVTGKPLLLAMADKSTWPGQSMSTCAHMHTTGQVFYQALSLFPNISIYASAYVVPLLGR